MKISYLKEYCVLASLLNFTKAAERLYITQPALSRHIAALEQEYGVVLIKRTTKNVELTEAGKMLRDNIIPVISQYDKAIAVLKKTNITEPLSLKVGIPMLPVNNYLGDVPELFRQKHPCVELTFHPGGPDDNLARLFAGTLDVIMISNIPFPIFNQVRFHDYAYSSMIILCSDRDPLSKKETVTLSELRNHTFLCENNAYFSVVWEKVALQCRWSGFEPSVQYFDSIGDALIAARQGFGVIAITEQHKTLATDGLAYTMLNEPSCIIRSSLAHLKTNTNPLIQDYIDIYTKYGYFLNKQGEDPDL